MKIIVIGAAQAGASTIENLVRNEPANAEILWLDQNDIPTVMQWAPDATEAKLQNLTQHHVTTLSHVQATALDAQNHTVTLHNLDDQTDTTETYDKLVLAVGSSATVLPVPGTELDGITVMHERQEINAVRQAAMNPDIQNVTIVGAGYIGIGDADIFSRMHKHVTVVEYSDRILKAYYDQDLTDQVQAKMIANGVDVQVGTGVTGFLSDDKGHVNQVTTTNGSIATDYVVLTAGTRTNTAWLNGILDLNQDGSIAVTDHMRTSNPDIYALGDAVQVTLAHDGANRRIALASNAARQAFTVSENLLGHKAATLSVQGTSSWYAFGFSFAATGATSQTAPEANSIVIEDSMKLGMGPTAPIAHYHFKLLFDEDNGQILGAQLLADQDLNSMINTLSVALQAHMTVEDLANADFYMNPGIETKLNPLTKASELAVEQLANQQPVA